MARRQPSKPIGGGGARHPASLANLRRGGTSTPGNDHALRHGAYGAIAREQLDVEAQRVLDAIEADAPLREADGSLPAAHGVAVGLLASALIRLQRIESYIALHGIVDDDGNLRPVVDLERRLRQEALDHAEALGMTPRSQAKLGLDLTRTAATAEDAAASRAARERLDRRAAEIDGEAEEFGDGR